VGRHLPFQLEAALLQQPLNNNQHHNLLLHLTLMTTPLPRLHHLQNLHNLHYLH
jgi:hypothetical protein